MDRHLNLTLFAIKLLKIPASSAPLKQVFNDWTTTNNHNEEKNKQQLLHIYYIHTKSECKDFTRSTDDPLTKINFVIKINRLLLLFFETFSCPLPFVAFLC